MNLSRRSTLQGLGLLGTAAGASCASPGGTKATLSALNGTTAAIPQTAATLLFNRSRAVDLMAAAKVDLIICTDPVNVFYLTSHKLISNTLGMDGMAHATFAAAGESGPALHTGKFSYYLSSDDRAIPNEVDLQLYTSPAEPELYQSLTEPNDIMSAAASVGYMTPLFDRHPLTERELARRKNISSVSDDIAATRTAALLRTLRDNPLPNKRIAVDDPSLIPILKSSGLDIAYVDGERLLRRIRLQKTAAELEYARYAASANAAAGRAAAAAVRAGATFQELRVEFAMECAKRLTTPVYILIDGVLTPLTKTKFEPGRAFLIDCVSEFQGYHGDYGRTVCIGEPNRGMEKVISALSFVWDRVLPELKVGTQYSDIWALGQKLFAETKVDAGLVMGPHAVGLHHTDEPGAKEFAPFEKENLILEENMVLSIDMPVLGSGLGGTAHLEDLVLIGKDGPELLNDPADRFIVV